MIGLLPPEPDSEVEPTTGPLCGDVDEVTGAVCTRTDHSNMGAHRDESDPLTVFQWRTHFSRPEEDEE